MKYKLKKAFLPLAFPLLITACQNTSVPTANIPTKQSKQIKTNLKHIQSLGTQVYANRNKQEFQNDYYQTILKNYQMKTASGGFNIKTVAGSDCVTSKSNLVANSSFELPLITKNWQIVKELPCWTLDESGQAEIDGSKTWTPVDGNQSIDLNHTSPGTISQSIATTPGTGYQLSFSLAGNPFCNPKEKSVEVLWGTESLGTFNFNSSGKSKKDMGWEAHHIEIAGKLTSSAQTTLTFKSLTSGSCGPALDAIALQATATPSPPACQASTGNGPTQPISLLNQDFSQSASNFGADGDWGEWGGDYYPTATGVTLWNPGPGQGERDNPGELVQFGKTGLLQTGVYKTFKLNYNTGDKLVAKLMAAPTFTHNDSDVTFLLAFNDPAQTVAVSSSLRGAGTKWQELYIESEIPACSTQVTVSVLGYLGLNESSSLTLEQISLEQIPANYYTRTELLNETLDGVEDNQFGANSPANLDGEFGYDFFSVPNWPEKYTGDRAVTASKASGSGLGNLTKRVDLPTYQTGDKITALMYAAATFTDPDSDTSFALKFYDDQGNLLSTETSALLSTNHYRWLILDRVSIPNGASYVEMAPGVQFGDNETSSMLWDNMLMYLYQG